MDRCNFRCPYCMPKALYGEKHAFLPERELLDFGELERLAALFIRLGATRLRLTGGEPLLRPGLSSLVARLKPLPNLQSLALTTNGLLLEGMASSLKSAGLDRVTVSLDSLDPTAFAQLSGVDAQVTPVLRGIDAALAAGLTPVKLNAVVVRGVNDGHVVDLVRRFRGTGVQVRFIEYMDVGTRNRWRLEQVVPTQELLERIHTLWPLERAGRAAHDDVAERYRFLDGGGEVGFVSSISRPFCRSCTRARLSAEGRLFTCLFGTQGLDVKALLRSGATDAELEESIRQAWRTRDDRYSEQRSARPSQERKVEMYQVGG